MNGAVISLDFGRRPHDGGHAGMLRRLGEAVARGRDKCQGKNRVVVNAARLMRDPARS